jgi:hypothetical protein
MAGAPVGNQNAARAKVWRAAIMRALERRKPADERVAAIDELADKLIALVAMGDLGALKEFGDRLDGKPAQAVSIDGDGEGGPVKTLNEILIRAVDAAGDRST